MPERKDANDRRKSLAPKTDIEATDTTNRIVELHGGSHIIKLINDMKPNASSLEVYAGVRNEALVNCSRLLNLPEDWALYGKTDASTDKFKFNPNNGEPLDTPEARLTFMENKISEELREVVYSDVRPKRTPTSPREPSPTTSNAVELSSLTCGQCGSSDFHFDPKLFEQLTPAGGEKPLFRQMIVAPEEQVAAIQGFDASAMFNPSAPIVLKCGHCKTDHTLGDPISGSSFLGELRKYYEAKGYTFVVQAKK